MWIWIIFVTGELFELVQSSCVCAPTLFSVLAEGVVKLHSRLDLARERWARGGVRPPRWAPERTPSQWRPSSAPTKSGSSEAGRRRLSSSLWKISQPTDSSETQTTPVSVWISIRVSAQSRRHHGRGITVKRSLKFSCLTSVFMEICCAWGTQFRNRNKNFYNCNKV